jgi:hypothetical protein
MRVREIGILLAILMCALAVPDLAVSQQTRIVTGEVMAIDTAAEPQTIVVKTTTADGRRLIVGCRLDANTVIRIGRRSANLDELRMGDRVRLTYLRVEDGLVARVIEKR